MERLFCESIMREPITFRIPYISFFFLICSLALPAQAQQVVASWNGGTGNWSVPTNWSPEGVPNNLTSPPKTYSVTIAAPSSDVTVDSTVLIDNFTLGATNVLNINAGVGLRLTAPISLPGNTSNSYGTLNNHGTLTTTGLGTIINYGALLNYGTGGIVLQGGGRLTNASGASLINSGKIDTSFTGNMSNSGTLINEASGRITFNSQGGGLGNGGLLVNSGGISILDGGLSNSGTLVSSGSIGISGDFASAMNTGTFLNSGMMGIGSHARMNNTGTFTNSGVLRIFGSIGSSTPTSFNNTGSFTNSGTVTIASAPPDIPLLNPQAGRFITTTNYTQTGGKTVVDGILTATGGAIVNIQGGTLGGRGVINGNVLVGGTLMPGGDSPGTLTIFGNYEQTSTGILDMLMGPLSQSVLDVHGNVVLDPGALLEITLLGGFNPFGRTFEIMHYDTLTGEFANGLDFWDDNYLWQISYGQNALSVTAVGVPEPGSFHLLGIGLIALVGLSVVRKANSTIIITRM